MRITKMRRFYQLTFMPNIFPVNCYLFEDTDGFILIDTGLPFSCKAIVKMVEKVGKPIKFIALTHPHSDHIGGLDKIKEYFPEAVVCISSRDSHLMKGDFALQGEEELPIKGGFVKDLKTIPEKLLEDNEMLGVLRVIALPGHTPGSIGFYDEKDKILIAGDALQIKGGLAVAGDKRILFPFPAQATWNKYKALESVKKLLDLPIDYLAVGHGSIMKHPHELLKKVCKRAETKLKKGVKNA